MKQLPLYLLIAVFFLSCSTTSNLGSDNGTRDGTSYEKAIIVKSISQEYAWVKENYPEYAVIAQVLAFQKKKPYDILTIQNKEGTQKDVYFDISRFYGKGF